MLGPVDSPATKRQDDKRFARQWRPYIFFVLLLAFMLRFLAAVLIEDHVTNAGRDFFVEGDANGYWDLAHDIHSGRDYSVHEPPRQVLRVPGFPLLLAGIIALFGNDVFAARCVLAAVGTACCWVTWLLGKRLVMRRVGFWAALIMAVHPWQVGSSVLILSESWFTLWMLLSLLVLVKVVDGPRGTPGEPAQPPVPLLLRAVVCGVFVGCAVLIRPGFLPWLAVAVVAVTVLLRGGFAKRIMAAGAIVVGCFAVMLPWTIRNHSVTGHYVVTSLWSGPSLYDGLNPDADGSSDMTFFDRDNVMERMTEYEMNAHYVSLAVEFAQEHPTAVFRLARQKLVRFLQFVPNTAPGGWATWAVGAVLAIGFWVLIAMGLRSQLLDTPGLLVVLGPFLLFLLVHMVFVGSLRYRLPAEFPLSILAAAGIRQWLTARSTDGSKSDSTA